MLKKLIPLNLLFSPDAAEGGAPAGTLVASDGSDNDASALEADADAPPEGTIDFGLFTGETETPAKPTSTRKMPQHEEQEIILEKEVKKTPEKEGTTTDEEEEEVKKAAAAKGTTPESDKEISQKRDYTKFDPADVEYLKKIPNAIFKHVAPVAQQRFEISKQLKETNEKLENFLSENPQFRIPENWYEHEEAYKLTPEWSENSLIYSKASTEISFWKQQLQKVRAGQPFQQLAIDDRGNIYGEGSFQPTPENLGLIEDAIDQCKGYLNRAEINAQNIINGFKNSAARNQNYYQATSADRFKQLKQELQPIAEDEKKFLEGFVLPQHRGSSLAKLAASMFSVMINQAKLLAKHEGKTNSNVQNERDKKLAGPPSKPKKVAAGVASREQTAKDEVDLDELMNEMQEG